MLQQDTGRVQPMPSTSEGTHLLAQDLVTAEPPRKGDAGGTGALASGWPMTPPSTASKPQPGCLLQHPLWDHHPRLSPSVTQPLLLSTTIAQHSW